MIKLDTARILIPTDFSITSEKAIKHAAFLAQLNKGELILLHVYKRDEVNNLISPFPELRTLVTQKQELRARLLLIAEGVHREYNIPVSVELTDGHITTEIVHTAEEHKVGLIVMGTEGGESVSNLFLGSNSNRVASYSSIPVMTVRAKALRIGYSKILLPVNLSDHSRQKVNYALQIAKLFAAQIYVVGLLSKSEESYRYKMDVILNQIKNLATEKNVTIQSVIINTDESAPRILSFASDLSADLIVTMTDEQTSFFGFNKYFDSQLVDEAQMPVLSVPPELADESFDSISIAGN